MTSLHYSNFLLTQLLEIPLTTAAKMLQFTEKI